MDGYKFIDKASIELEGAWHDPNRIIEGFHEDISLDRKYFSAKAHNGWIGEAIPNKPFSSFEELVKLLYTNFPDECDNERCSMHIHISLKSVCDYEKLMTEDFYYRTFHPAMENWGKKCSDVRYHYRIGGKVKYCVKKFQPEVQVATKEKSPNRYTSINYSYAAHKTLENRLAPMFTNKDTCIDYIKMYFKCVEDYLEKVSNVEVRKNYKSIINVPKEQNVQSQNFDEVIQIKTKKFKPNSFSAYDRSYVGTPVKPNSVLTGLGEPIDGIFNPYKDDKDYAPIYADFVVKKSRKQIRDERKSRIKAPTASDLNLPYKSVGDSVGEKDRRAIYIDAARAYNEEMNNPIMPSQKIGTKFSDTLATGYLEEGAKTIQGEQIDPLIKEKPKARGATDYLFIDEYSSEPKY